MVRGLFFREEEMGFDPLFFAEKKNVPHPTGKEDGRESPPGEPRNRLDP